MKGKLATAAALAGGGAAALGTYKRSRGPKPLGVHYSALILRALTNATTGAVAAAATTLLPESPGGNLNWDYGYSWVRDSFFGVRSLAEIGFGLEADGFRRLEGPEAPEKGGRGNAR